MRRFFLAIIMLSLIGATSACGPAVVVGASAGVGAYSYIKGELVRSYPASYHKAVATCESVAKELKITIDSKTDDGIMTTLKGHRAKDTPVTIKVKMLDPDISQVGVRVGAVGLWDRDISQVVHSHIDRLI